MYNHAISAGPFTRRLVVLIGVACAVAGCGVATDTAHPTTTVLKSLTLATVPQTTTVAPSSTPDPTLLPLTTIPPTTTAVPASPAAVMPAVVCMNLQDAQNKIHAAGVFYSRSKDYTGKGRHQIIDRNWIVVAQSPSPGTPFGEGDAVLSVVKYGEPNNC
ncbi:PASTA domain-containing protein [Nocardia niigatensis]|uniref:PASTA domain-containing protein n=1 Tax=Nocardia niigatensis TaxID=209249 RepID=UPI001FDEE7EF|nr:PASTA domain-containing protein [Nocardia niigatensis]